MAFRLQFILLALRLRLILLALSLRFTPGERAVRPPRYVPLDLGARHELGEILVLAVLSREEAFVGDVGVAVSFDAKGGCLLFQESLSAKPERDSLVLRDASGSPYPRVLPALHERRTEVNLTTRAQRVEHCLFE
jgi:hypothetical protein